MIPVRENSEVVIIYPDYIIFQKNERIDIQTTTPVYGNIPKVIIPKMRKTCSLMPNL